MKYIFDACLLLMTITCFSACLKDKPLDDYESIQPIILIPDGNWPGTGAPAMDRVLSGPPLTAEIKLYARVSWSRPLDHDLEVVFQKNGALLPAYNAQWGMAYEPLAENAYELPSLKLIIPAGKQEAYLPIKIYLDRVDASKQNMLAFTIGSAGGKQVAENFKSILFPIVVQ